jgi:hypothetical protein
MKVMEKTNGNMPKPIPFDKLNDIIELSHKKVMAEHGNADKSKQAWARVLIQAIGTYGNLLRDVELEQLAADVEELKRQVKIRDV